MAQQLEAAKRGLENLKSQKQKPQSPQASQGRGAPQQQEAPPAEVPPTPVKETGRRRILEKKEEEPVKEAPRPSQIIHVEGMNKDQVQKLVDEAKQELNEKIKKMEQEAREVEAKLGQVKKAKE